jgi:hypothetical protein
MRMLPLIILTVALLLVSQAGCAARREPVATIDPSYSYLRPPTPGIPGIPGTPGTPGSSSTPVAVVDTNR